MSQIPAARDAPAPVKVTVDEADTKAASDEPTAASASSSTTTRAASPQTHAQASALPATRERRSLSVEEYYSSRPKFDRLGNPIPQNRAGAMASVYGNTKIRLPGDLGAKDPRRPKSPAPAAVAAPAANPSGSPRPGGGRARAASDDGNARLAEDPPEAERPDSDEDADPEVDPDADADADADNDNDTDGDGDEGGRGRGRKRPEPGRTTSGKAVNVREDSEDSERETRVFGGQKPDPTKGESKLSFLNDPGRKKATPKGGSAVTRRRVLPSTAFDSAPSATSTPVHSDDESHSELRAAQKLTLTMSSIHSTPSAHRVIRQIIRGDFEHFQREAEEGRKRQRMYLVATDLSPEAQHALEWTIGTVLRDGDTLFAVYAADEETVGTTGEGGVEIGHGAESVRDTAAIVRGLPATFQPPNSPGPSPLARTHQLASATGPEPRSRSRGIYSNAESERRRALEGITDRCVHLLRKTRLQVRVVVEVFHCKSPRHMITEVIDFLSPTLVVIGSRGRSAVKGVLLGSFSNYLVTKSSVPVMVARKKLKKHSTAAKKHKDGLAVPYQGSGRTGRFSNIIEAPKAKGLRVRSWDEVGID